MNAAEKDASPGDLEECSVCLEESFQDSKDPNNEFAKLAFGILANAVEWYDFGLFGLLAPQVGRAFFPGSSTSLEMMKSFGVVFAAFVMRPFGGVVFGIIGDRIGRHRAVHASVMMMAGSTVAVGCLPTYEQVGFFAPTLLLLCRIAQGVSVGGQLPGTVLWISEGSPVHRRCLYFSMVTLSGNLANVAAAFFVAMLHEMLSTESLDAWGWRLPFFTGVVAILGGCSGAHDEKVEMVEEKHVIQDDGDSLQGAGDLLVFCRRFKWPMLQIALIAASGGCVNYNLQVWMPSYLDRLREPPLDRAYLMMSVATACIAPTVLLFGCLADHFGPMIFLVFGLTISGALTLPLYAAAEHEGAYTLIFWVMALLLSLNMFWCTLGAWMPFLVEPGARYRVTGIGLNSGMCLFGGSMPLISTALEHQFCTTLAPACCQLAVLSISWLFAVNLSRAYSPLTKPLTRGHYERVSSS